VTAPDGRTAALLGDSGSVFLSLETGTRTPLEESREVSGEAQRFLWASFSPDGAVLAAAISGERLHLYAAASGQRIATVPLDAECTNVRFHPDGHTLLVSDVAGHVHFLPVGLLRPTRVFELGAPALAIALGPRGGLLAATLEGRLALFEGERERPSIHLEPSRLRLVTFSPDGRHLIVNDRRSGVTDFVPFDAQVPDWQLPTGATEAYSPDGAQVWLSLIGNGELRQVEAATGRTLRQVRGAFDANNANNPEARLAVGPGGEVYIASGVALFVLAPGQSRARRLGDQPARDVSASPDGALLWVASPNHGVFAADPRTGEVKARLPAGLLELPTPDGREALFALQGQLPREAPQPRLLSRRSVDLPGLARRACEILAARDASAPAPEVCKSPLAAQ
jgi:WD40 repeat protein